MATTPTNCDCGATPGVLVVGLDDSDPDTQYYVHCKACDITGPTRTRRIRAVKSWNDGRRLPVPASGEDPFTATAPLVLSKELGISIPGEQMDGASEGEVTTEVLDALKGIGFLVVSTKHYGPVGWYMRNEDAGLGNTAGQGDIRLRKHRWPKGLWIDIELKGRVRTAELQPNQKVLAASDGIFICWNADMVLEAIRCTEESLRK